MINIVIADSTPGYADSLAKYFLSREPGIRVSAFSDSLALNNRLDKIDEEIDILLVDQIIFNSMNHYCYEFVTILLSNESIVDENRSSIRKYQPADRIFSETLDLYYSKNHIERKNRDLAKTKLLLIYSVGGGVGKTSICLCLAETLTNCNKKVLVFSLEGLGSFTAPLIKSESLGISRLLINTDTTDMLSKLNNIKTKDPNKGFYFVDKAQYYLEIANNLSRLIEVLIALKNSEFDYVLIDTEGTLNSEVLSLFEHCYKTIHVVVDEPLFYYKYKNFIDQNSRIVGQNSCQLEEQNIYILNKFENLKLFNFPSFLESKHYFIPKIENLWTEENDSFILDNLNVMKQSIVPLTEVIIMENENE